MTEFGNPILAGATLIRAAMQSEGFLSGSQGWRVERDGTAEFQELTARGDIDATGLTVENGGVEIRIDPTDFNLQLGAIVFDTNSGIQSNIGELSTRFAGGTGDLPTSLWAAPAVGASDQAFIQLLSENDDQTAPARILMSSPVQNQSMRATFGDNQNVESVTATSFTVETNSASFTFVAPISGIVTITLEAFIDLETGDVANISRIIRCSYEVREGSTIGSGAIVLAADNSRSAAVRVRGGGFGSVGTGANVYSQYQLTGLTPNDTYNIQTMHSINDATNVAVNQIASRSLLVRPET